MHLKNRLETVSIAEPLPNRRHARKTPNAVNSRREGGLSKREKEGREEGSGKVGMVMGGDGGRELYFRVGVKIRPIFEPCFPKWEIPCP